MLYKSTTIVYYYAMVRVLREKGRMQTQKHCPAVYARYKLPGVGHMKNGLCKLDISLKFMLRTFENQTFFLINSINGKLFLAHITNIFMNSLLTMLINPFSPSEKVQSTGFYCI